MSGDHRYPGRHSMFILASFTGNSLNTGVTDTQDVHHGDGTQLAFLERDDVLVCSIHRYDGGKFYPCSTDAAMEMIGGGPGRCAVSIERSSS